MAVPPEVVHSLRILGLTPDATADDVRSAFRRLTRTYHPDVAGRRYSLKFEQIAKAYAFLKDLPQEEFSQAQANDHDEPFSSRFSGARENAAVKKEAKRSPPFSDVLGKPLAWYRKRQEFAEAEKERRRRAAEDAEQKILREREFRIEAALIRGESAIDNLLGRRKLEMENIGVQGLILRLTSDVSVVRHLALEYLISLGEPVNRPEILEALFNSLHRWDIDEKTARLLSALSLNPENHGKMARGMTTRAAALPNALLSYLLQLHRPHAPDLELLEAYLDHAAAGGVALILRQWPRGDFVSEPVICRLISRDDESVLVAVLSAMKQRSVPCPKGARKRLNDLLFHPNIAVRVWAKALTEEHQIR